MEATSPPVSLRSSDSRSVQERAAVVREAEPAPVRERLVVRELDVQRDVLEPLLAEVRDEVADERRCPAAPARLGLQVDEG